MKKHTPVLACVTLALVFGFTARFALEAKAGPKGGVTAPAPAPEGQRAPSFRAKTADGTTRTLADLAGSRPLVLVFIQDGCPCSELAQPFFNRLHEIYKGDVEFAGVIDADAAAAKGWAGANHPTFPLLLDPGLEIVHRYGAERSTYVALVGRGGETLKVWPGYSKDMLLDLGRRLAEAAGSAEGPLVLDDAPREMHSGCAY